MLSILRLNIAMEPDGLFIKGHPLTYALSAVLLLFFVLSILLNLKKDKFGAFDIKKQSSVYKYGKAMSFIMLASCIISAVGYIAAGMGQRFEMRIAVMVLLSAVMAFTFLPLAVFFGSGKYKTSLIPAALVPVFITAVMLIVNYISVTQMATPAQYGYLIIAQLSNVLCFYYLAKFLSGASCARGAIVSSSFAAVANCAAYIAPLLYAVFNGQFTAASLQGILGAAECFYAIAVLLFVKRESVK